MMAWQLDLAQRVSNFDDILNILHPEVLADDDADIVDIYYMISSLMKKRKISDSFMNPWIPE